MTPRDARPATPARRRCARTCAAALAGALAGTLPLLAAPAAAQTAAIARDSAPASRPHADDAAAARAARRARDAQAAFERRRRRLLPVSDGDTGRCDVRIGAWCYWYDPREPVVAPEPAAIGAARASLLAVLDAAARDLPRDPWIVGQRVRYLVEDGRTPEARAVAEACDRAGGAAGDPAWCAALAGYARHVGGDPAGAEADFDRALATMPPTERCRWTDPRMLLPRDAREALGRPCAAADTVAVRFWRLATPFLSRGGNDRRNEHLARRVLARLFANAATPYGDRWRDDLDELLLRYGWPDRWSRRETPPSAGAGAPVSVVGHEPWPSYRFTPDVAAVLDPAADAPSSAIDDRDAHERAAVPGVRSIVALDLAAAAFRRGDALLVVAVAAAPPEPARSAHDSLTLVVAPERGPRAVARAPRSRWDTTGAVTLAVAAPIAPALAGVEAITDTLGALRGRAAIAPPPLDRGFGVSDLLLYAPRGEASAATGATLDDARRTALPTAVRGATTVGLYWELYGLPPVAHAVETTVRIDGEPPGWLSRAWTRLRRSSPATPPRLRWTDVGIGGAVAARTVTLDLGGLAPGRYRITLEVRHADGRAATARRVLDVRRR